MKLKRLNIEIQNYGPNEGKYVAKVYVGDDWSNIDFTLSPEFSHTILPLIIDQLAAETDKAAIELKEKLFKSIADANSKQIANA